MTETSAGTTETIEDLTIQIEVLQKTIEEARKEIARLTEVSEPRYD